jgi:hypothetical protein
MSLEEHTTNGTTSAAVRPSTSAIATVVEVFRNGQASLLEEERKDG